MDNSLSGLYKDKFFSASCNLINNSSLYSSNLSFSSFNILTCSSNFFNLILESNINSIGFLESNTNSCSTYNIFIFSSLHNIGNCFIKEVLP